MSTETENPGARPSYLRVVLTTWCSLGCPYCHREGLERGNARTADPEMLAMVLRALLPGGVRKVKLLGGEPLLYPGLSSLIRSIREHSPQVDLSLITNGVASPTRLRAAFAAGMDRANLSIHGFGLRAFAERGGNEHKARLRAENVELLLGLGRPLKLNFVHRGPGDDADLSELLAWATGRPVVLNVLDDLGNPEAGAAGTLEILRRLRGPWSREWLDDDPFSLPATQLAWDDGLRVEVKTSRLGEAAPWGACRSCPHRPSCREGVFALRLDPGLRLRCCPVRPEFSLDLAPLLGNGEQALRRHVDSYLQEMRP